MLFSLMTAPSPARLSRQGADLRRLRILAQVQAGSSYAAIGREEKLSRERVRQIVAKALEAGGETRLDHARVQIARLEPALRLAAGAVADGELAAIDRLLRVLDRLDRYSAVEGADAEADEGAREKLLAKVNAMAERLIAARQAGLAPDAAGGPPGPAGDALDEAETLVPAEQSVEPASAWLDAARQDLTKPDAP